MLTENDVVDIVSSELQRRGFKIERQLSTTETGIDIEATSPEGVYYGIEAKGATSSKVESSRYGKEFNKSQVKTHIGMALIAAFRLKNKRQNAEAVIALPDNANHRALVAEMHKPLSDSGIKVWLVNQKGIENYI